MDHIVTPAGAFGFVVAEDALDRYFITKVESWTTNRLFRAIVRVVLNPSRAMSNLAQGQSLWFRPGRPLR